MVKLNEKLHAFECDRCKRMAPVYAAMFRNPYLYAVAKERFSQDHMDCEPVRAIRRQTRSLIYTPLQRAKFYLQ